MPILVSLRYRLLVMILMTGRVSFLSVGKKMYEWQVERRESHPWQNSFARTTVVLSNDSMAL